MSKKLSLALFFLVLLAAAVFGTRAFQSQAAEKSAGGAVAGWLPGVSGRGDVRTGGRGADNRCADAYGTVVEAASP